MLKTRTAGGEFAQQNLPGVFGVDYQFIDEQAIDFFLNEGVNTIRLPFLLVSHQFTGVIANNCLPL
jgi:hypothetical protein